MEFLLDKELILERLGGDQEIFVAMARTYLQEVDRACGHLGEALASGDATALWREAHTVKGLLATLSDDFGAALGMAVETRCRSGECAGVESMVADLQARLRVVAAAVRAEVGG